MKVKNTEFRERLKQIRKDKGIKQGDLAKMLDVSRSTISAWEVGQSEPETRTLRKLAKILEVSVAYLLGETSVRTNDKIPITAIYKKTIPVFENVGAGGGKATFDKAVGTVQTSEGDFGIIIKGDSMLPIPENAIAVVEKVYDIRDVKSGSLVVVRTHGDEAMLKYWDVEEDYGVVLRSENSSYRPKFYPWEAFYANDCELIGIVVQIIMNTRHHNYNN